MALCGVSFGDICFPSALAARGGSPTGVLALLVSFAFASGCGDSAAPRVAPSGLPEGFVSLFSGKDFTGWEGNLEFFRIEDGAVVAGRLNERVPRNEFLCTMQDYRDFELRLQIRVSSDEATRPGRILRKEREE